MWGVKVEHVFLAKGNVVSVMNQKTRNPQAVGEDKGCAGGVDGSTSLVSSRLWTHQRTPNVVASHTSWRQYVVDLTHRLSSLQLGLKV